VYDTAMLLGGKFERFDYKGFKAGLLVHNTPMVHL
jgi:hypothetical protein